MILIIYNIYIFQMGMMITQIFSTSLVSGMIAGAVLFRTNCFQKNCWKRFCLTASRLTFWIPRSVFSCVWMHRLGSRAGSREGGFGRGAGWFCEWGKSRFRVFSPKSYWPGDDWPLSNNQCFALTFRTVLQVSPEWLCQGNIHLHRHLISIPKKRRCLATPVCFLLTVLANISIFCEDRQWLRSSVLWNGTNRGRGSCWLSRSCARAQRGLSSLYFVGSTKISKIGIDFLMDGPRDRRSICRALKLVLRFGIASCS